MSLVLTPEIISSYFLCKRKSFLLSKSTMVDFKKTEFEKLESNFIWTEGTITEIKLNVSKGTTGRKDVFLFEFQHNGKKIIKVRETYKPELLKVGQKFKIKVHPEDSDLIEIDLKGT